LSLIERKVRNAKLDERTKATERGESVILRLVVRKVRNAKLDERAKGTERLKL
jgi:hypothetical protein